MESVIPRIIQRRSQSLRDPEIQSFLRDACRRYWYVSFVNLDLAKECYKCDKAITGTCIVEFGNSYSHLSCSEVSTKMESLLLHFRSGHDDLILTGKLQKKGREGAVCFGCNEPVVGPGYVCSASGCKFLLHKSCAELHTKMQHPFPGDLTLSLVEPQRKDTRCRACSEDCKECFSYKCPQLEINLDIKCARSITNNRDDCQHVFRPIWLRLQITCDACGEEGKDIASQCNICQLLIHQECRQFSRAIKITSHPHCLHITYSPWRFSKGKQVILCDLCYEKLKTEYGAYFCKKCKCSFHLKCAYKFFDKVCEEAINLDFDEENEDEGLIGGAKKIKHFSHPHVLNLSNEELMDNKPCDGCMTVISTPFYSCTKCNYFLHDRCVHLLRKKRHLLHPHQLTLVPRAPYCGGRFRCCACHRESQGFSYHCATCKFDIDVLCSLMSKDCEVECHHHTLFLAINSSKTCKACGPKNDVEIGVFVCGECDLILCFECATLPRETRHIDDDHLLNLAFEDPENPEDCYCVICEEKKYSKHRHYKCAECKFFAHIECVIGRQPYIKYGSKFRCENHEHRLTFVQEDEFSSPSACDVCGEPCGDLAVKCDECKFNIHASGDCFKKRALQLKKRALQLGEIAPRQKVTTVSCFKKRALQLKKRALQLGEIAPRQKVKPVTAIVAEEAEGRSKGNRDWCDSGEEIDVDEETDAVEDQDSEAKVVGELGDALETNLNIFKVES